MQQWVYVNGQFVAANEAAISPFDRGFLFGHAAYEVSAVYAGRLVDFEGHMTRLRRTLDALDIPPPMPDADWRALHAELLARNSITEGLVYLQVSGGAYGQRDFAGPEQLQPGVFMYATEKDLIAAAARDGVAAVVLPDTRWARRDLKTTQLLSQALAYRSAREAGADVAIMHEDGTVTEAASANVWIVSAQGQVMTRDLSISILAGITRGAIMAQLKVAGVEVMEGAFDVEALKAAREVFTTSAGALIAPVTAIDGVPVGDGRPGQITRTVQRLYYAAMGADVATVAPWAL